MIVISVIFAIVAACLMLSELVRVLKTAEFWKGLLIMAVYTCLCVQFLMAAIMISELLDFSDDAGFAILLLSGAIYVIGFFVLAFITEEVKSFGYALILILSLGSLGFGIYQKVNPKDAADMGNAGEFVDPHHVSGYTRADGTQVKGYYRDGDGNPFTNLTKEEGGGYFRNR